MHCEFRLTANGTVIGIKEMDRLPEVDDEVTLEGRAYRVDTLPTKMPAGNETAVIYVRQPFGI